MTAKLDRRLRLVLPIERETGALYAHAEPLSAEQFHHYYLPLAKTFAKIYKENLGVVAGPRVAAMLLREVAAEMGRGEEVEASLIGELKRLTNVLGPTEKGWEAVPLEDAVRNNLIDADEASEVENAVCFFTLVWHMHRKAERAEIMASAAAIWDAQLTSSSCTDYIASLRTSRTSGGST